MRITRINYIAVAAVSLGLVLVSQGLTQNDTDRDVLSRAKPVIWQEPGDIASRDLRFGPGAPNLAPAPPYTFVEEDKDGDSPKFRVKDANGVVWTVKLGPEAQSETVAVRLVWSIGYFSEEAYYLDKVRVKNLPRLSRGREHVTNQGIVTGARFEPKRESLTRAGSWDWMDNPFVGTRELNGLKVLMVLLNNYDATEVNNRILIVNSDGVGRLEARYLVSDLGASLGRIGGLGGKRSKNDVEDFSSSLFIRSVSDGVVEFDYRTRPQGFGIFAALYPPYYKGERKKEKSMKGVPVEHARWVGSLLSQLTDVQLRDAFRAAHYDNKTTHQYISALRQRIHQLTQLKPQSVDPVADRR